MHFYFQGSEVVGKLSLFHIFFVAHENRLKHFYGIPLFLKSTFRRKLTSVTRGEAPWYSGKH
jgi:hypothetical protein